MFDSLESTQIKAKQLDQKAQTLDVICALRQTKGQGTFGKSWISPPQSGLYVTFAFKLGHLEHVNSLSHLAACAACMSVDPIGPYIKWPNDILVSGQKLGGVLTEIIDHHAYVGIGLNLKFHKELNAVQDQKVTAYDQYKTPPLIEDMLPYLSTRFLELLTLWEQGGFIKIKHIYERYFPLLHKPVIIHTPEGLISGLLVRFSDEGYPVIKTNTLETTIYHLSQIFLDESP